jgi:hypothetical protein
MQGRVKGSAYNHCNHCTKKPPAKSQAARSKLSQGLHEYVHEILAGKKCLRIGVCFRNGMGLFYVFLVGEDRGGETFWLITFVSVPLLKNQLLLCSEFAATFSPPRF